LDAPIKKKVINVKTTDLILMVCRFFTAVLKYNSYKYMRNASGVCIYCPQKMVILVNEKKYLYGLTLASPSDPSENQLQGWFISYSFFLINGRILYPTPIIKIKPI
jgi:hypothetical protein